MLGGAVTLSMLGLSISSANAETVRVGSKAFPESVILGEIVTALVRDAGAEVEHELGFGGTRLVYNALLSGEIDVYIEYTGTLVQVILQDGWDETRPASKVIAERLATLGIDMSAPIGSFVSCCLSRRLDKRCKYQLFSMV